MNWTYAVSFVKEELHEYSLQILRLTLTNNFISH